MSIKVTATANGYYGKKVRVPGETFMIDGEGDFSEAWMTRDDDGPETRRVNTGGTDGVVGEVVAKGKGRKVAAGGSDNDDRSRDMAVNAEDNAPAPDADPLDHDENGKKGGAKKAKGSDN
jgi:hypothetical protein